MKVIPTVGLFLAFFLWVPSASADLHPSEGLRGPVAPKLRCTGADFGSYTAIKIYYVKGGMYLVDGGTSVLYDAYFDQFSDGTLDAFGSATFDENGLIQVYAPTLTFYKPPERKRLVDEYHGLYKRVLRAKAEGKCAPF